MEIRSKEDLMEYLPDDAPWIFYRDPVEALRAQCVKRGLDPTGHVMEVSNRLDRYSQLHPADERRIFPWRYCDNPLYVGALNHAHNHRYLITEAEDNSNDTSIEKRFTLWDPSSDRTFYTIIGRISRCSCPFRREEVSRKNYTCGHIVYVLRYVLGCPEPLRWQQALLFKEVQAIFRYSTALHYAVNERACYPNWQCVLCFRDIHGADLTISHCCGLFVHRDCQSNAQKAEPRGLVDCILHSSGLFWMGTEEASAAAWKEALLPPLGSSGNKVLSSHPPQSDEEGSDDRMAQSWSDDGELGITDDGDDSDLFNGNSANRSIDFFAERSQISHRSPSIESSSSSSAGSVAIKQEPESPCPPPRRQLPSRAAKEATRARPDAYTGSSPRRQALAPSRGLMLKEWTKKLSTTPIPLPVIPGFAQQQLFGSQPARRAKIAVPIPVAPASAQGRVGSSRANDHGSPLRTAAAAGSPPAHASATARPVAGLAGSAFPHSDDVEVRRFSSSFSPSPAPRSPPVRLEANPFVSFPIPPDGSTFASMSLAAPDTAYSSPSKKKKKKKKKKRKKKLKMSPERKRAASATTTASVPPTGHQASTADGLLADGATTASTATATTGTTTAHRWSEVDKEEKSAKRDRRMARLIKQMSRLEEDADKVKKTKEYVEHELERMEKKKRKVIRKMNKLWDRDRSV